MLGIFDLATPFFEASRQYRVQARHFREEREYDRGIFREKIKYLKRHGLISSFVEGKEKYIELTPKGIQKAMLCNLENLTIAKPEKWDHKWRVVIYDIPEKNRTGRNYFQLKLKELGFEEIQKSVYVHPFECSAEIKRLSQAFLTENHVSIMISEIIQGEEYILEKFIKKDVLCEADLK